MVDLLFYDLDETYVGLRGERAAILALQEYLRFQPKGFQFSPKFKSGYWDGWISLVDTKNMRFLKGLLPRVISFCEEHRFDYQVDPDMFEQVTDYNLSDQQVINLYKAIGGPYVPHDSQVEAVKACINTGRSIILAPTANGKSYILHAVNAFYTKKKLKTLIIIDRSQLVLQLRDNFVEEYGSNYSVATIYDDKIDNNADVFISTWQSVYQKPKSWFNKFGVLIGDEVHRFKAKSLITLIEKCGHIYHRFGVTGTLDNDSKIDALTLTGLFAEPIRVATTRELIEAGIIARPTVYAILLNYPAGDRKKLTAKIKSEVAEGDGSKIYKLECDLIEQHPARNQFIKNLTGKSKGNTLVAFHHSTHGKALVETLGEDVFFSDGSVSAKKRHTMSKQIDKMSDALGVVSLGTFSTGINIKNINNLIIACLVKSEITVPQLIGRSLRISDVKSEVNIFDIGDNLSGKGKNVAYKHFEARIQMYVKEGFEIKFIEVDLN